MPSPCKECLDVWGMAGTPSLYPTGGVLGLPPAGCPPPHCPALPLQDLGAAAGSKRPTCVILIKPHEEYQEAYDECLEDVEALPLPL